MTTRKVVGAALAAAVALLASSEASAFGPSSSASIVVVCPSSSSPPPSSRCTTALRDSRPASSHHPLSGRDRRSTFPSYAPYSIDDGRVGIGGEVGRSSGSWGSASSSWSPGPPPAARLDGSPHVVDRATPWASSSTTPPPPPPPARLDVALHVDRATPEPVQAASAAGIVDFVNEGRRQLGGGGGRGRGGRDASPPPRQYAIGSWKTKSSSSALKPIAAPSSPSPKRPGAGAYLRRPIVAGNWKLNPPTRPDAIALLRLLAANFVNHRATTTDDATAPEAVIFPPLPYLSDAVRILEGSGIQVGAQNAGIHDKGAYTGEVSPSMLLSSGCSYVLLGHSERRSLFGETDERINAAVRRCLDQPAGLKVMLCVGETLEEYEDGRMEEVIDEQIRGCLNGVDATALLRDDRVVIAYEPVWAIGTGLSATPLQAQEAHVAVRTSLSRVLIGASAEDVERVRVLYGGSVSPETAYGVGSMTDVDGALVGGASLNADSFARIYDGTASADAAKKASRPAIANGRLPKAKYPPRELIATEVLPTKNALGESPVWSDRDQALYWVSATEGEVWRWNLRDPPYRRLMNTAVGCIGLAGESNALIVAGESGILLCNMNLASEPMHLVHRPDPFTTTRPNDGRVDRFGNLVIGMYNQYHRAGATEGANNAGLYRLSARTLEWEEILLDYRFRVSNCICFSGDGRTMYFGDTPTRRVYAFDYAQDGPLTNRRLVWQMPSDVPGAPDGAQVDDRGKLWIAVTGGGMVVQLDPKSGEVETIVRIDANPTSVTFGGPDLDELFITTRAPNGGGLWRVKMPNGVRGLPEPEFK